MRPRPPVIWVNVHRAMHLAIDLIVELSMSRRTFSCAVTSERPFPVDNVPAADTTAKYPSGVSMHNGRPIRCCSPTAVDRRRSTSHAVSSRGPAFTGARSLDPTAVVLAEVHGNDSRLHHCQLGSIDGRTSEFRSCAKPEELALSAAFIESSSKD